jgi:hypothetical protein
MAERIENVQSALQQPLKDMGIAVAEADARHALIEETLRKRVADLTEASDKARESSEYIRNILRGQAQEISALSGEIAGKSHIITDELRQQKSILNEEVEASLKGVDSVRSALESQAARLGEISQNVSGDISRLDHEIAARCIEIESVTTKAVREIAELDETVTSKTRTLKDNAETAENSLRNTLESLKAVTDEFEPIFNGAMEKAGTAKERFETLHNSFEATTDSNLARLREIGVLFDERLSALRIGSDLASNVLRSSSEDLQARANEIERAANSASDRMRDIEVALEGHSNDIHLTSDQALLRIENVQKTLNNQFHELSESVGQALARISGVGDALANSAESVRRSADETVNKFERAGSKAREESEMLNIAAGKTSSLTTELVTKLRDEAAELLRTSRDTLMELKKTGDALAVRTQEVEKQMEAALAITQKYTVELRQQAGVVAEASFESSDKIAKATTQLSERIDDLGSKTRNVVGDIAKSRDTLEAESDRLATASSTALRVTDEASSSFARQSGALLKAVQEASLYAEKIRKEEWRVQRDSFMAAAKFIVESLHSLSVDITRMLEGEIQEKTWKSFQKGDVGAFTRRLAQMGDKLPVDRIRDKFANDSEFRSYVQRFLRQFEEVYDQAVVNDHGELLASTFASSDVGKLYSVLCAAAGRDSRINREDRRVA